MLHIVATSTPFLHLPQQTCTHAKHTLAAHLYTCALVGPLRQSFIFHQPWQITERGDRYNRCTSCCQSCPALKHQVKKTAQICENQHQSHVSHVMRVFWKCQTRKHIINAADGAEWLQPIACWTHLHCLTCGSIAQDLKDLVVVMHSLHQNTKGNTMPKKTIILSPALGKEEILGHGVALPVQTRSKTTACFQCHLGAGQHI